jgi:S-adenosylmethionine:tRNA ribosyltransferase-isomerase
MDVSLFDFELPEDRIALRPANPRDSARLLVVHGDGRLEHRQISDLPDFLRTDDVLVANDTKVIPARLHGHRQPGEEQAALGPKIELFLHKRTGSDSYLAFARPARKLAEGDRIDFPGKLSAHVISRNEGGEVAVAFSVGGAELDAAIAGTGEIPLPPYIAGKRKPDARDASDYQTMFARNQGSVAAPTAGLHFTDALVSRLQAKGIMRETVTLHVGAGTFLPVSAADTADHKMHAEWATLGSDAVARINAVRAGGGRVTAVGTTSLRTLESAARPDGILEPFEGETDIFITPGYEFKAVDVLLTNFHLPRSTLFMLVCALMGTDRMKAAYAEAIREQYRFYSYGDACLLLRTP